jgi:hypothetical protein
MINNDVMETVSRNCRVYRQKPIYSTDILVTEDTLYVNKKMVGMEKFEYKWSKLCKKWLKTGKCSHIATGRASSF